MGNVADSIDNIYYHNVCSQYFSVTEAHKMGHRDTQEDAGFVLNPVNDKRRQSCVAGIFDGHFGHEAALRAAAMLSQRIKASSNLDESTVTQFVMETDHSICKELAAQLQGDKVVSPDLTVEDSQLRAVYGAKFQRLLKCGPTSGSTGVMCFVEPVGSEAGAACGSPSDTAPATPVKTGSSASGAAVSSSSVPGEQKEAEERVTYRVRVANVGDSRCIVLKRHKVKEELCYEYIEMTEDHKPERDSELTRIKRLPGKAVFRGRVMGQLAVARGFGDLSFKLDPNVAADQQAVICVPEWRETLVGPGDMVLLYCDGVTEKMSNDDLFRVLHQGLISKLSHEALLKSVFKAAQETSSTDNMSATLVHILPPSPDVAAASDQSTLVVERHMCDLDRNFISKHLGSANNNRERLLNDLQDNRVDWELVKPFVQPEVQKPSSWECKGPPLPYELLPVPGEQDDGDGGNTPPRTPVLEELDDDGDGSPIPKKRRKEDSDALPQPVRENTTLFHRKPSTVATIRRHASA